MLGGNWEYRSTYHERIDCSYAVGQVLAGHIKVWDVHDTLAQFLYPQAINNTLRIDRLALTEDQIAWPIETPIVDPSCLNNPSVAVLVAMSLPGIAACNAISGGKNSPPRPRPASKGYTSCTALQKEVIKNGIILLEK